MALTDDEKSLLEKLQAKASEPDNEDFEIEVYNSKTGDGARVPFSKGSKWLFEKFGIGEAPAAPEGTTAPPAGGTGGSAEGAGTGKGATYFGGGGPRRGA